MQTAVEQAKSVRTSIRPEDAVKERARLLRTCGQKILKLQQSFPIDASANEIESWAKSKEISESILKLFQKIQDQEVHIETKDFLKQEQAQIAASLRTALTAYCSVYRAATFAQALSDTMVKATALVTVKAAAQMLDSQLREFNRAFSEFQ